MTEQRAEYSESRLDPPFPAAPAKAEVEEFMDCELCGRVDHHCVRGACPECRTRLSPAGLLTPLDEYIGLAVRRRARLFERQAEARREASA